VERSLTASGRGSYRAESESPRYSTRTILALHWRTLHGPIRAKDATIACFGSKHRLAASALVDELAGVSWHRFAFGEAANRTYQHRFKKKVAHARLSTPTETSNTSWLPAKLLLYPQNRVFCRLSDSEFDDGFGWNLDLLLRLRIKARPRFPLLLYELAKTGQDKFAVLFNRFVREVAECIDEYSSDSFVSFGGNCERDLKFTFGHVWALFMAADL
jgi:hypothetical protein